MNKAKVLIIDDDPAIVAALNEYLQIEGHTVIPAANLKAAFAALENDAPDLAILDYQLPDGDALQFLAAIKSMNLSTQCIVLTGYGTIDLAVRAIKEGAEQFITKPVQFSVLSSYVRNCLEHQQNKRKGLARKRVSSRYDKNPFHGASPAILRLAEEVHKIISTERPILIQGETGTGKGVLSQWIHQHGSRSDEALVEVNCAGLSRELLESELFGHEKGAFTGASSSKQGLVEIAQRGILFLDEIGEMDIMVQPKLLRILEDNRFRRLGGVRELMADIQIIAATNRNLMQFAREMKFREDLYFRISTFHLQIPPLRERLEDIQPLAETILRNLANDLARERQELSSDAVVALKNYGWPGNIRELRNLLERVALTCDHQLIARKDLSLAQEPNRETPTRPLGPALTLAELERQYISRVLDEEAGRVSQAAIRLGIPRSTLYQKIKVYGLMAHPN